MPTTQPKPQPTVRITLNGPDSALAERVADWLCDEDRFLQTCLPARSLVTAELVRRLEPRIAEIGRAGIEAELSAVVSFTAEARASGSDPFAWWPAMPPLLQLLVEVVDATLNND